MKDTAGDEIGVETDHERSRIALDVHDTQRGDSEGPATAMLSAKKARKLARKLLEAADELDGGTRAPAPLGVSLRVVSDGLDEIQLQHRSLAGLFQRHDEALLALQGEQAWDREQIVALLAKVFDVREGPTTHETGDDGEQLLEMIDLAGRTTTVSVPVPEDQYRGPKFRAVRRQLASLLGVPATAEIADTGAADLLLLIRDLRFDWQLPGQSSSSAAPEKSEHELREAEVAAGIGAFRVRFPHTVEMRRAQVEGTVRDILTAALRVRNAHEPANATPKTSEPHYLLPASWIVDHVRNLRTDIPTCVTFALPTGVKLEDRISTGFDR